MKGKIGIAANKKKKKVMMLWQRFWKRKFGKFDFTCNCFSELIMLMKMNSGKIFRDWKKKVESWLRPCRTVLKLRF